MKATYKGQSIFYWHDKAIRNQDIIDELTVLIFSMESELPKKSKSRRLAKQILQGEK